MRDFSIRHSGLSAAVSLAAFLALSGPAFAQTTGGEEDSFAGQPQQTPAPVVVEFDDREQFVPPSELPIEDVYVKEAFDQNADEARNELTAVAITPGGEAELLAPDEAAVNALLKTIEAVKAGDFTVLESAGPPVNVGANEAGDMGIESVIGADTRTQITSTTTYAFRTIGRIDIGCTGTLIGPRHVLTAGHCVYNIDNDKWYSNLNFTPGQSGSTKPWGTIGWKRAIAVKGWTQSHKRDYDYAMIVLSQDIGGTVGWMGYGWKNPMPLYNVNINGYPGDKPSGTMWHSFCTLQIVTTYRLYYPCDTYGGNSGSGVYVYFQAENKRTIYGIHAYGVDSTGLNGATRIREAVFENLKQWKATY